MTRRRSFVLLEVLVALVILGITLTALLRGFMVGMNAMRELKIMNTASQLAESLLDDFELEPPRDGKGEGRFADDPRFGEEFANYTWEYSVEEDDIRYRDTPRGTRQEQEPIRTLELTIRYDDGVHRQFVPIRLTTYLMETQLFTDRALQANQLF